MNTATMPAEATALNFGDQVTKLHSTYDVNRELTRYVACLGNHLEPNDQRSLLSIGAWAGGIWAGHSEIGGCPTMRRTHHMILRGLFTPLETTATSRKADHREVDVHREAMLDGVNVPMGTRGYTIFAGDDLAYLQNDYHKPMGIVEISPLMGVEWNSELRRTLQSHFFPEWQLWQKAQGEIPVLLDDWVDLVKKGQANAKFASHDIIASELLESARLFRNYASNYIERNRQIIQSMRSTNTGGQYFVWHNKARMYATQIGEVLEDEKTLAKTAASGDMAAITRELQADRELRERELTEQKEYNRILMKKLLGEDIELPVVVEAPKPIIVETRSADEVLNEIALNSVSTGDTYQELEGELNLEPIEEESETTPGCSEFNGKGEPCRARVKAGAVKCTFHLKEEMLKQSE